VFSVILGVMQPYLFPYLGYYQLVQHCDVFVFYDTVNFIKGGYINRNNILVSGDKQLFTLPIQQASANKSIASLQYTPQYTKVIKTIEQAYSKAPYVDIVMPIIKQVLASPERNVAKLSAESIKAVMNYLSIEKIFYFASELDFDKNANAADKLYAIAKLLGANNYCNAYGGKSLYTKEAFYKQGINLTFCQKKPVAYSQSLSTFIDNLSMIDVLMWNSPAQARALLHAYHIE